MSNQNADAFDATLRLWGMVHGVRLYDEEPARASHTIARAMQHGAKSRNQYVMDQARHRAKGPRVFRAKAAGLAECGHRISPAWATDPVRCKGAKGGGIDHDPNEARETPEVITAQTAWLALHMQFPRQAKIMALEYQRPDLPTQAAKAAVAGVSLRQYEDELARGRHWMRCAFAMHRVVGHASSVFAG